MTDVRAYVPGQTGTLADVVEQGPDLRGVRPAGPDSFAAPAGFGELFHAYRVQNRAYRTDFDEITLRDGYAPIVDALGLGGSQNPAAFYDNSEAHEPVLMRSDLLARQGGGLLATMTDRATQEQLIAGEIRARRAKDPDFLAGVPDTVDGLHGYFREAEAKKRQAASSTIARGPGGWRQALTGLGGGGVEAFHDPLNILTLPIGGGGKTLVQTVGREALVNGLVEALSLPSAAHNLDELGEHLTAGEAVKDVGTAAAFGGLFGGTLHLAGAHLPPAVFAIMPDSVQRRWADRMKLGEGQAAPLLKDVLGDMDNRELAGFARSTIGDRMTPDEKAAGDVLEREQELGEASPFMAGPAGDGAHQTSLAEGLKRILDGVDPGAPSRGAFLASSALNQSAAPARPVTIGAASVPHDIVEFFRAKGLSDAQAYGIAAGIFAEARGDHTAVNPKSGALGLGQWLGERKAALIDRHGPNPSRQQQLEFLWHELSGGDAGGKFVLAEKDAGRVLDAYIRRFMRPAAGAETLGDLERGMDALGHRGELPEGAPAAVTGEDDLVAALRREAEQADEEALAASLGREEPAAELGRAAGLDAADVPILKRELFGSDADWFEAQVAFHDQVRGENAAQGPGNGPPARAEASGPPEVAQAVAEARPGGRQSLREWFGQSLIADEQGRPLIVYHGSAWDFDQFDVGKAGEGRGSTGERALFFSTDPDVASHSALVAGAGHATGEPTHTGAMSHNGGVVYPVHLRVENPLMSKLKFYNGEEFAREIERAKASGHDAVIFEHVKSRGENGTIAVFSPDQVRSVFDTAADVRIDEPALKAFEDPRGPGISGQVDSLEHDYRMAAADPDQAKRVYQIDDDAPRTLLDILEELDRDREAAAALRACVAP